MDPERARDPSISPPTLAGMVAMRLLLALLVSLAAVVPVSARAQDPETAPPFVAGGHLLFATPTGSFAENVDFGFGLGGHGRYVVDDGGILSLRLDLGLRERDDPYLCHPTLPGHRGPDDRLLHQLRERDDPYLCHPTLPGHRGPDDR